MRRQALLIIGALLALAVASCGGSDDDGSTPPNGTLPASGTSTRAPAPGPCAENLGATPPAGGLTWAEILPDQVPAPAGWSVQPAEGEGPFLSVSDSARVVGTVELLQFPLDTLTEPPFDPQGGLGALQAFAEANYDSVREDREVTFGEDYVFEQDEPEPTDAGKFCAVRYSFKGSIMDVVQDRVEGYVTYDSENLYLFVAPYDAANAAEGIGFLEAGILEEYAPSLGDLVAALKLPS